MRNKTKVLVDNKYFEYTILSAIIVSSIHLALDNPLNNPKSTYAKVLVIIDYMLTSIFTFEAFLKMLAFGILLNGP